MAARKSPVTKPARTKARTAAPGRARSASKRSSKVTASPSPEKSPTGPLLPDLAPARALFDGGMRLCKLHPLTKRPVGTDWQKPEQCVAKFSDSAAGYGLPLAINGRCSIDPDQVEQTRAALAAVGFDLDALMQAGVRTISTRPGSGGRSMFADPGGLRWLKLAYPDPSGKTGRERINIFELRAGSTNLQDVIPGLLYRDTHGNDCTQAYANGRTYLDALPLPEQFAAWWARCSADHGFWLEQQRLMLAALGIEPAQRERFLSHCDLPPGAPLPFKPQRVDRTAFNKGHPVEAILAAHGYTQHGERWSPPGGTGSPGVRCIPGKDDLWRTDHGSDPLHGTFDAWAAFVMLEHGGDLDAAERAVPSAIAALGEALKAAGVQPLTPVAAAAREVVGEQASADPVELSWDAWNDDPEPVRFLIPGWLPDGVVTLFAAHGGTGKSYLSLLIALCLATGRNPLATDEATEPERIERVKVYLYSAEDSTTVLQFRLARYMRLLGIKPQELKGWLKIVDATESDNVLFSAARDIGKRVTERMEWLRREVAAFGAGLLIFDNASDAFDGNENERAAVRQFLTALKSVAPATLLLAHVDALSSMVADADKAKGYSGSTGWHNSARSRWFMARDQDGDRIVLKMPKANYSKAGTEADIAWDDSRGVFRVLEVRDGRARAADHRDALLALLAQVLASGKNVSPSPRAGNNLFKSLQPLDGFPRGLDSRGVHAELARWQQAGLVRVEQYAKPNRGTAERLVLTEEGRAATGTPAAFDPAPHAEALALMLFKLGTKRVMRSVIVQTAGKKLGLHPAQAEAATAALIATYGLVVEGEMVVMLKNVE